MAIAVRKRPAPWETIESDVVLDNLIREVLEERVAGARPRKSREAFLTFVRIVTRGGQCAPVDMQAIRARQYRDVAHVHCMDDASWQHSLSLAQAVLYLTGPWGRLIC